MIAGRSSPASSPISSRSTATPAERLRPFAESGWSSRAGRWFAHPDPNRSIFMTRSTAALFVAMLATPTVANAGARQQATVILSDNPDARKIEQEWGFADAVVTGDTLYLSGVVAGLRPGETGLITAYDRAFQRIGKILERAGASWDDVVDITSFHTDLKSQMPA